MTPIDALRALLAFIDPKQMMSHEQQCVWFEAKRIVEEQTPTGEEPFWTSVAELAAMRDSSVAAADKHKHVWSPIPGETARYLCDCGQTGYRSKQGITPHKRQPIISKRWTATGHTRGVGGQVARKPGAQ